MSKRTIPASDDAPLRTGLLLDVYEVDDAGQMRLRIQTGVPLQIAGSGLDDGLGQSQPGFELWAGFDAERRRLLVVTQVRHFRLGSRARDPELTLFLGDIDRLDAAEGWTSKKIDDGGYGLDVRQTPSGLVIAYRTRASAVQIPLPLFPIDPLYSGWPVVELDEGTASDAAYAPVRVTRVDLASLTVKSQDFPGGEHPRIASLDPFMLVVERPQLSIRFRAIRRADGRSDPRVDWDQGGMHKVAFLTDEQARVARGVLHTFSRGRPMRFPRAAAPWIDAQDLFSEPALDGIGWASTSERFPLEVLRLDSDQKGLFVDFLRKEPHVALLRSRARLATDFAAGTLDVTDLFDSVLDINHEQIGNPADLAPDTTGENLQFAPFGELGQNSGPVMQVPAYRADTTIGGSLIVDRDGLRHGFVSYTDWGDGGTRVIFDADLGPPEQPTPVENKKRFEPESVPGPGSGDEQWVEIAAAGWMPMPLPFVPVSNSLGQADTVASAVQLLMGTLVHVAENEAGIPLDDDGWTRDEVNEIQTTVNELSGGALAETIAVNDGLLPAASIRVEPGTPAARSIALWEAVVDGLAVTSATWRFQEMPPAGPLGDLGNPFLETVEATGNPAPVALPLPGAWSVRADITLEDGSSRTLDAQSEVGPSLFTTLRDMHRALSPELPNGVGSVRLGTATFTMIQHRIEFPVGPDELNAQRLIISELNEVDSQWRFVATDARQGRIGHRLRIHVESEDIRLSGLISTLASVESIDVSFFYEREYTPAILTIDGRSAVPLTGDVIDVPSDLLAGSDSHLPSSLSARPVGNGTVVPETIDVRVSMLPQAIAAGVVTLLIGLAAVSAATVLVALIATMVTAGAVSAIPIIGIGGAILVIAAAIAVALFIAFAVPPLVQDVISGMIRATITGEQMREDLDAQRLLQFAGEGVAEAIARAAIDQAIADGMTLAAPAGPEAIGTDRFRTDTFQMVHVSEGRCRLLIRG